jgi:hypothetical protein
MALSINKIWIHPLWRGCCVLAGAAVHPCHVLRHFAALARRQRLPLLPQEFQVFYYALLHLQAFLLKSTLSPPALPVGSDGEIEIQYTDFKWIMNGFQNGLKEWAEAGRVRQFGE